VVISASTAHTWGGNLTGTFAPALVGPNLSSRSYHDKRRSKLVEGSCTGDKTVQEIKGGKLVLRIS